MREGVREREREGGRESGKRLESYREGAKTRKKESEVEK